MLLALLGNLPSPIPPVSGSTGGGGSRRRRPNEKVIWHDDWIRAQEDLTEFKALPEPEQINEAELAIEAVEVAVSTIPAVADAKEALEAYSEATDMLLKLEYLNTLMVAHFMLQYEKRRENEIAALLMLGIL